MTDADRAAIAAAWVGCAFGNAGARAIQYAAEATYVAGLAAGRAREIEECAKVCEHNATLYNEMGTGWESSVECAAAIRARMK
jgi:hypothetical protein